jgi:hypothetical protein
MSKVQELYTMGVDAVGTYKQTAFWSIVVLAFLLLVK